MKQIQVAVLVEFTQNDKIKSSISQTATTTAVAQQRLCVTSGGRWGRWWRWVRVRCSRDRRCSRCCWARCRVSVKIRCVHVYFLYFFQIITIYLSTCKNFFYIFYDFIFTIFFENEKCLLLFSILLFIFLGFSLFLFFSLGDL